MEGRTIIKYVAIAAGVYLVYEYFIKGLLAPAATTAPAVGTGTQNTNMPLLTAPPATGATGATGATQSTGSFVAPAQGTQQTTQPVQMVAPPVVVQPPVYASPVQSGSLSFGGTSTEQLDAWMGAAIGTKQATSDQWCAAMRSITGSDPCSNGVNFTGIQSGTPMSSYVFLSALKAYQSLGANAPGMAGFHSGLGSFFHFGGGGMVQ